MLDEVLSEQVCAFYESRQVGLQGGEMQDLLKINQTFVSRYCLILDDVDTRVVLKLLRDDVFVNVLERSVVTVVHQLYHWLQLLGYVFGQFLQQVEQVHHKFYHL